MNYEYAFLQEEIIYHVRRAVDDMIAIAWIQKQFDNERFVAKIEIDSIGKYLNQKNIEFGIFDECIEFLEIINDVSNSYKHSVYQTTQVKISESEPSFYVYSYKANDNKNGAKEFLYSQSELMKDFQKMLTIYLNVVYE